MAAMFAARGVDERAALAAAPGVDEQELIARVRGTIRTELSPRHVPDVIVFVPSIPRNRTGKPLEIPVKRLVNGSGGAGVIDSSVLVEPEALPAVIDAIQAALAVHGAA